MIKKVLQKSIIIYGGKSTSFIITEMIDKKKYKVKFIFDPFMKNVEFETKAIFSNKKKDLKNMIKKSNFFAVGIAREHGLARVKISQKLETYGLKPISLISKSAIIDNSSKIGEGLLAMPACIVHKKVKIGKYCILNSNSCVDHESNIGEGVHIMGSAYVAGRVTVGDYATIGANATILPDINIGKNAIVGAGAVVTKDVKQNEIVVGNPAKFLKKNNPGYRIDIFKNI
ncbi:sugar O-acyltransferase (sialic acid O-acetyltransferase NeuD family) [Candidatus Pelagibacter ubique]|uniref:Sugar O-acyltransferase (Sialic acid O-acetyltransferase NeuD family) n=1 Tax=Pelagibacter ubique TaxID=198252 RepID=A0ABX1T0R2_PELUQ|nr:NeuD/PglB/VioB family sugar acetyltransferase [Candidatus Pelagibacter ubique]NMN67069.1 sugar O-acyltransferase (sialic acid O-acetyltransferase NeuD family) [Candidatus Pelagibacter ubique]